MLPQSYWSGEPTGLEWHLSSGVCSEEPQYGKASAGVFRGLHKGLDQAGRPVLSPWHPEADLTPGSGKLLKLADSGRTEDARGLLTSN